MLKAGWFWLTEWCTPAKIWQLTLFWTWQLWQALRCVSTSYLLDIRAETRIFNVTRAETMAEILPVSVVQGISTGKYHAAVMTNNEQWESACVRAGRSSGDLAHPLVYCPELHFSEFTSAIADMKNSVAVSDRAGMEIPAPSHEPDRSRSV